MKEITLHDMAKMYKKEYEYLNRELERLEKVLDKEDYELTPQDEMVLSIAHNLTNPPHTITNSQLAFLWNMDKRSTNRITTDLTTKKLRRKMEKHPKLKPGAFQDDPEHQYLPQDKDEPEDIMESFNKLAGLTVNEQSDQDYATARKIADAHDKGPITPKIATRWAKEAGVAIDNVGTVVQLANEILGYAGLDEGKKVNEQGAGAAVAGVPGAAKKGKGYTLVGAGTGGKGPEYTGEELDEKKAPNSGTVAFHFTTADGLPYFGEADVVVSKDVDDARGPITTIDSIRVKSIVDKDGNPVAITDEMKSAAKQAVEEMEDIDLLVSAGYEDDDYYGDDDIEEGSLTDQQYIPKESEPKGPVSPKPGSSAINEENEGVMKTLATRKMYKNRPPEMDPEKQLYRKDVWIPREKKSDILARFKDKVQKVLKEMELEGVGVETETEPAVEPKEKPGKTNKPANPLRPTPGITPKPKAEEAVNPDVQLFIKNRKRE